MSSVVNKQRSYYCIEIESAQYVTWRYIGIELVTSTVNHLELLYASV